MRRICYCWCLLLFLCFSETVSAQTSFFYGGYRAGKYLTAEGNAQVYAGKFNLGWEFSKSGDDALIFFTPGATEYTMDKYMEYGNLPQGITLGAVLPVHEVMSLEVGFHRFSQKATGKRTNLTDNSQETFTLQSRTGGLSFNLIYTGNERFMPFIGMDFGHFRFRYSYEATGIDIEKQSLGYKVSIGGSIKPGDKTLYLGMNYGVYIRLLHLNAFDVKLVPQYQGRLDSFEDIFRGLYQHHQFHHDNWSVSLLLTKDLNLGQ
ncbi:MAG: hypothetical protein V4604_10030 [Bacteroidota bacterium]